MDCPFCTRTDFLDALESLDIILSHQMLAINALCPGSRARWALWTHVGGPCCWKNAVGVGVGLDNIFTITIITIKARIPADSYVAVFTKFWTVFAQTVLASVLMQNSFTVALDVPKAKTSSQIMSDHERWKWQELTNCIQLPKPHQIYVYHVYHVYSICTCIMCVCVCRCINSNMKNITL